MWDDIEVSHHDYNNNNNNNNIHTYILPIFYRDSRAFIQMLRLWTKSIDGWASGATAGRGEGSSSTTARGGSIPYNMERHIRGPSRLELYWAAECGKYPEGGEKRPRPGPRGGRIPEAGQSQPRRVYPLRGMLFDLRGWCRVTRRSRRAIQHDLGK
eukprot:sb/3473158/